MYDTYSRYIYEWLTTNRIADKINTMVDLLTVLRDRAMYIFIAVFFILLVIVAFKFVTVRGRNV
jgi:hypothetical protein